MSYDGSTSSKKPAAASMMPPNMLIPSTSTSFITLISDSLRLRHETLAMAFVYINKYLQYLRDEPSAQDLLDDHVKYTHLGSLFPYSTPTDSMSTDSRPGIPLSSNKSYRVPTATARVSAPRI